MKGMLFLILVLTMIEGTKVSRKSTLCSRKEIHHLWYVTKDVEAMRQRVTSGNERVFQKRSVYGAIRWLDWTGYNGEDNVLLVGISPPDDRDIIYNIMRWTDVSSHAYEIYDENVLGSHPILGENVSLVKNYPRIIVISEYSIEEVFSYYAQLGLDNVLLSRFTVIDVDNV